MTAPTMPHDPTAMEAIAKHMVTLGYTRGVGTTVAHAALDALVSAGFTVLSFDEIGKTVAEELDLRTRLAEAEAQRDAAIRQRDDAVRVLRKYAVVHTGHGPCCRGCGHPIPAHAPTCDIAAVIRDEGEARS